MQNPSSLHLFLVDSMTMNNEAKAYKLFVNQGLSGLSTFDAESVRIKNERLHAIINKPLNGTFDGSTKDELAPLDSTGNELFLFMSF